MKAAHIPSAVLFLLLFAAASCGNRNTGPTPLLISEMNLKRGDVISCGPADQQLGTLSFQVSGTPDVKEDFTLAVKLLHSFEYDEAEKVFACIIDKAPGTAMAYWGVAMCNFHPLWTPPTEAELKKGAQAIGIATGIERKTERESDYIAAIGSFYKNYRQTDHLSRCLQFEKAMEALRSKYPDDMEASLFYALALNAAADPADKTFAKQKKAGAILDPLYRAYPDHPGAVHYIIHTYDAPELAHRGLEAARRYASIAPSSAHALHMPSHIFTRLGLWQECISANLASVRSAQCYAQATGLAGHWDEELHGLDYLVYAYLQRGQNGLAKAQLSYLDSIREVHPANFKVAYAFAAMPARYVLENKQWAEAAGLPVPAKNFSWEAFPWQKSIIHFARVMGALHTGNNNMVTAELTELGRLHTLLVEEKDAYKAGQVAIQMKTAEAWKLFKEGKTGLALAEMSLAASLEDNTIKHPVTPGEVIPARELLADMLLQMNRWDEALAAYEAGLKKHPNRFNGLHGAGVAAELSGRLDKARSYYKQLHATTDPEHSTRPELKKALQFLQRE